MSFLTAEIRGILEEMYPMRQELSPCFLGDPGISKTQSIYDFANDLGVKVVTFILSNTVPSEVSGIRMPDKDTKKMEVFDDMRMASLEDGDILFFDEILEAPPMLWSACLTLIQDRIMASGRKLPDVFIVAASNYVASPGIIPASTRDRFQFIELSFDWLSWCDWFKNKYGVLPDEKLKNRIEGDSTGYNILTPRRVTKLYEWLKDSPNSTTRRSVINKMFDGVVLNALLRMINYVPSGQEQITKALKDSGFVMPMGFEGLSLKKMLEVLQARPEWDEIKLILENIEFMEGE